MTRAAVGFVFVTVVLDMPPLDVMIPAVPKLVIECLGGDTGAGTAADRMPSRA